MKEELSKFWEFTFLAETVRKALKPMGGLVTRIAYRAGNNPENEHARTDLQVVGALVRVAISKLESYHFSDPDLVNARQRVLDAILPGANEGQEIIQKWVPEEPDWQEATRPQTKEALLAVINRSYPVR